MAALRTLIMSLAVAAMFIKSAVGTNHTVGAPGGSWDLSTNLNIWAASQTFSVGDNLVFQYTAQHSVLEVSKADYDSCQINNPILSDATGSTVIPLSSARKRYFICGTIGHCSQGMKLEVDTVASTISPPASSPPPTSSTPPTPPAKSPSPTPPSPPSSAQSGSPTNNPTESPLVPFDESPPAQPPSNSGNKGHLEENLAAVLGFGTLILLTL